MKFNSILFAGIAVIASATSAFAGASVTNKDVYRVTDGMSDTIVNVDSNKYTYESGSSAAIKLEAEGDRTSSGYNCNYYGCYSHSHTESGAYINVSAGDNYYYYNGDAEVYGSAEGSTVIGAASESEFSSTEYTYTDVLSVDWANYLEVETTHTVSTDAF